jgi:hypothetical protein
MESNKRREGMYNIIDFQLMGGLSEHKNGWAILLSSYFYDLVYYHIGDMQNGHGNLYFLNGFFFIILFMFNAW